MHTNKYVFYKTEIIPTFTKYPIYTGFCSRHFEYIICEPQLTFWGLLARTGTSVSTNLHDTVPSTPERQGPLLSFRVGGDLSKATKIASGRATVQNPGPFASQYVCPATPPLPPKLEHSG